MRTIVKSAFIALYSFLFLGSGLVLASDGSVGISMGTSTRMIFHSDDRRVSFPVRNETKLPMLIHGLVLDKEKKSFSQDFIITPEIGNLKPNETKYLQLIRLGGHFPEDRESLLYLQGHFLPSSNNSSKNSSNLTLSYAIQMKMFYRPAKLRATFDAIDDVADQLEFMLEEKRLRVSNKTPYFITINSLSSDKKVIAVPNNKSMIDPFGSISIELDDINIKSVTWTLLNDGGYATKPITKRL